MCIKRAIYKPFTTGEPSTTEQKLAGEYVLWCYLFVCYSAFKGENLTPRPGGGKVSGKAWGRVWVSG